MFNSYICKFLGHRVHRKRVWNDGLDYRTSCGRCDKPLLRDSGGWRSFSESRDSDPARLPHPRERRG